MKLKIKRTRFCNPLLSLHMFTIPVLVYGFGKMAGVEYNQYEFVWWILIPAMAIFWFFFNFKVVKISPGEEDVQFPDYFAHVDYTRKMEIEVQKKPDPENITPESLSLLGWTEWDNPYTGKKVWAKHQNDQGVFPELPGFIFEYDLENEQFFYNGGEFSSIRLRITTTKDLKEIVRLLLLKQ